MNESNDWLLSRGSKAKTVTIKVSQDQMMSVAIYRHNNSFMTISEITTVIYPMMSESHMKSISSIIFACFSSCGRD